MPFSSRKSAILKAREFQSVKPVFLDTETTGLDANAEIVEICVVGFDGDVLVESLVKPKRSIPPDAVSVHGISNEMVAGAPSWAEVWPAVAGALIGKYVGIYNAEFDLRLMRQSHQLNGMPWEFQSSRVIDVMLLYSQFQGTTRRLALEKAGQQCGIPLPNSHRARDDTLLLRALFHHIASRTP
jgi:DNA polymerase-3 subunit epsilon